MLHLNKTYCYDALVGLRMIPDNSIDCIVTSPPYWALRDYKVKGQLGMERTPELYVKKIAAIFMEAYRVLKPTGVLWLNLGDTYWGGKGKNGASWDAEHNARVWNKTAITYAKRDTTRPQDRKHKYIKAKDLCGIPWTVALKLRDKGWYLRQDIIWNKLNPMPESVTDRCTRAHEYLFMLTKSRKYYFDAAAIAEPYKENTFTTFGTTITGNGDGSGKMIKSERFAQGNRIRKPKEWKVPAGWDTSVGQGGHGSIHKDGRAKLALKKVHTGPLMANKKSVWSMGSKGYDGAHYATFPPNLIRPCILAGCPPGGTVLDMFMGSGTTAEVAHELERNHLGFDLDPKNLILTQKRMMEKFGLLTEIIY